MDKTLVINGSPRPHKSNSKKYASLIEKHYKGEIINMNLVKHKPESIVETLDECKTLIFVFPLYVDSLPARLLDFLKYLEANPPKNKPVIHIMINCGFFEPYQNDVALKMMRYYCRLNEYEVGSTFILGAGEAILTTPFAFLVELKLKKFAKSIVNKKYQSFQMTMPLTKPLYLMGSKRYWINKGKVWGLTEQDMRRMEIE